ncbi:MAG: A/G-specific adenine glycosylase [Candidatus Atribacteria bacterium]|nr:A/G-specific adenine glycosylase [Candidatus Atribacteria bacterium]
METNQLHHQISILLVNWYETNQRSLPWRKDYSPYSVWISEIMLQQTQVDRVIPYYFRWMQQFPTLESVSIASYDDLLRFWEGLGYYSRVKFIHKTSKIIRNQYGCQFPKNHQKLLELPGIGPYTAGAIMSIAFNQNYPLVDGNIIRILSRIFNIENSVKQRETKNYIWKKAEELILPGKARWLNQALMELGALVCTPKTPRCLECPVQKSCLSFHLGCVEKRPVVPPSKKIVPIQVVVGVLLKDGLFFIQQRPPNGLMADLWEFPGGKINPGEKPEDALIREFREELQFKIHIGNKIATLKHGYTNFSVTLHAYFCQLIPENQFPVLHFASNYRWVKPQDLFHYAFPAANRRLIDILTKLSPISS